MSDLYDKTAYGPAGDKPDSDADIVYELAIAEKMPSWQDESPNRGNLPTYENSSSYWPVVLATVVGVVSAVVISICL